MRKTLRIFVAAAALSACGGGGDDSPDDESLSDRLGDITYEELRADIVERGYSEDQAQCIVGMVEGAEGLDTLGIGFVSGGCGMTKDDVESALFGG